MIRKVTVVLMSLLFSLAPLSSAHAYACQGKVSRVAVSQNGRVSVISTEMFPDGQGRDVCNLYMESKGVQPAVCRGWLAVLMAAQVSNRTVTIQYALHIPALRFRRGKMLWLRGLFMGIDRLTADIARHSKTGKNI